MKILAVGLLMMLMLMLSGMCFLGLLIKVVPSWPGWLVLGGLLSTGLCCVEYLNKHEKAAKTAAKP